jgi:hypothetical protein
MKAAPADVSLLIVDFLFIFHLKKGLRSAGLASAQMPIRKPLVANGR